MRFEPATLTVVAGRPVRLTVRNQGSTTHDFTLSKGVARPVKVTVKAGRPAAPRSPSPARAPTSSSAPSSGTPWPG